MSEVTGWRRPVAKLAVAAAIGAGLILGSTAPANAARVFYFDGYAGSYSGQISEWSSLSGSRNLTGGGTYLAVARTESRIDGAVYAAAEATGQSAVVGHETIYGFARCNHVPGAAAPSDQHMLCSYEGN